MNDPDVWLIGSGPMACAYSGVLKALGCNVTVVGRGASSAAAFREKTGIEVIEGGLQQALRMNKPPSQAIVATGVETLAGLTHSLLEAGVPRILVEKPAGLSATEVNSIADRAASSGSAVKVAYNRRFFASVLALRERIAEEGGLLSITFDFTEMPEKVNRLDRPQAIKERWLLANSTHVIDLAFHLAGPPRDWNAFHGGTLDWHPSAAFFAGAGTTDRGALFAYTANWAGPGRWGLELVTSRRRYILRPMERLAAVSAHMGPVEDVPLDLDLDQRFKPGLYRQVAAFLSGHDAEICGIEEHRGRMQIYERMGGYA